MYNQYLHYLEDKSIQLDIHVALPMYFQQHHNAQQ